MKRRLSFSSSSARARHGVHRYILPLVAGAGFAQEEAARVAKANADYRLRHPGTKTGETASPVPQDPPDSTHPRGDAPSPQPSSAWGDILTPPTAKKLAAQGTDSGVTSSPPGRDILGKKGVTLCHPTQIQTQKRDPKTMTPETPNSGLSSSKSIDCDNDRKSVSEKNGNELFALLEINPDRIRRGEQLAMNYLARAFTLEPPTARTPESMIGWLDAKLKWLAGEHQRYPKVVFARMKQLQRGDFILPEEWTR